MVISRLTCQSELGAQVIRVNVLLPCQPGLCEKPNGLEKKNKSGNKKLESAKSRKC